MCLYPADIHMWFAASCTFHPFFFKNGQIPKITLSVAFLRYFHHYTFAHGSCIVTRPYLILQAVKMHSQTKIQYKLRV